MYSLYLYSVKNLQCINVLIIYICVDKFATSQNDESLLQLQDLVTDSFVGRISSHCSRYYGQKSKCV